MLKLLMEWFRRFRPESHVKILKVIIWFFALIALGAIGYKILRELSNPSFLGAMPFGGRSLR